MKPIFASLLLLGSDSWPAAVAHSIRAPGPDRRWHEHAAGQRLGVRDAAHHERTHRYGLHHRVQRPRVAQRSAGLDWHRHDAQHLVNVALTWQDNGNNGGHWEGTAAGYDEVYQLDVTSGADKVTGVIVDGPDIQVITAPTAGASLDSTMPITTTWDRINPADEARVAATGDGGGDGIVVPDTGSYAIAPGTLHADKAQARTNTLRITRTNRVTPAFAVAGSLVSVSVANEVDVVALPCPSC